MHANVHVRARLRAGMVLQPAACILHVTPALRPGIGPLAERGQSTNEFYLCVAGSRFLPCLLASNILLGWTVTPRILILGVSAAIFDFSFGVTSAVCFEI